MTHVVRFATLIAMFLFVSTSAWAQQWCAYNPERDTRFNCGYSTAQACEKATRENHGACTVDPFYD
ncbi:MAG: DUF3551 domain-containing protein [Bradyrhizobiaceae bacterium]|nr:DUF3551 domain-containing protein [Bradyrhizobiaceae bacterium]